MCYGFPTSAQKMVNVNNAQGLWIDIDGDVFNCFKGQLIDIEKKAGYKEWICCKKS